MFCEVCLKDIPGNAKSFSNHSRWHKGLMTNEMYAGINKEEKNGQWKGDAVGLDALHDWARRHIKKPEFCSECHTKLPFDIANISQEYKRNIDDWEWLCRSCHRTKHAKMTPLKVVQVKCETCGITFTKRTCWAKKVKHHFCSHRCTGNGKQFN